MTFIDASKQIKAVQDQVLAELLALEGSDLPFLPKDDRNHVPWRVMLGDDRAYIMGPMTHTLSAHRRLQLETVQLKLKTIMSPISDTLNSLGGYLNTPISIGFERRHTGMVFYFMGFALKGCLDGTTPSKWVLPKVLKRVQAVPTGTGVFKLGHHTFLADSPQAVIQLYLILSAPKTDPAKRKKPKAMAQINRVWDYESVMDMQKTLLDSWPTS